MLSLTMIYQPAAVACRLVVGLDRSSSMLICLSSWKCSRLLRELVTMQRLKGCERYRHATVMHSHALLATAVLSNEFCVLQCKTKITYSFIIINCQNAIEQEVTIYNNKIYNVDST